MFFIRFLSSCQIEFFGLRRGSVRLVESRMKTGVRLMRIALIIPA